ncbi:hypothetical protein MUN88_14410 [Gracilibacillus caseinilyticus]|uniref:Uncharacterized protein n=1 Tax=Gracilibacillus caseinilyticus TaxID=2932256 RepID=A0ABY4ES45_9BACI|nr:hypothetical protein [Gracilibacillus caseinilyticus]UOQ47257.1 hypothetical protein MUN88_14410 [Gracilibacillus caseinilyticus]
MEVVKIDALTLFKIAFGVLLLVLAIYTIKTANRNDKEDGSSQDNALIILIVVDLIAFPIWGYLLSL